MPALRGLTLFPEYAALTALGYKTVETRPGPPAGDMRPDGVRVGFGGHRLDRHQPFVVVAGRRLPKVGVLGMGPFVLERSRGCRDLLIRGEQLAWPYRIPSGHALAVTSFAGAWPVEQVRFTDVDRWRVDEETGELLLPRAEFLLGDYGPGRWALPMTRATRFSPVLIPPLPTTQGVYALPEETTDRIEGLLSGVTSETIWEYMRSAQALEALLERLPAWAEPWATRHAGNMSAQFDRMADEIEQLAAAGETTHPIYGAALEALLAGDEARGAQHLWAHVKYPFERPQRAA